MMFAFKTKRIIKYWIYNRILFLEKFQNNKRGISKIKMKQRETLL